MGTSIRSELSRRNPYWIGKHRYYELKHFCLQYPIWQKAYFALDGLSKRPDDLNLYFKRNEIGDPTARCGLSMAYFSAKIEMVKSTAEKTDPELSDYILKGVTEGLSYDILKARLDIPCSKDTYYDRYRLFFWLLDKERN